MPEGKVCRFMDPLNNRHERTVLWKYGLCCSLNSIQLITWEMERNTIIPNYFVRMFVHCIIRVACLALLRKKLCPLLSTAWEYVSLRRVSRSTITLLYQKNCRVPWTETFKAFFQVLNSPSHQHLLLPLITVLLTPKQIKLCLMFSLPENKIRKKNWSLLRIDETTRSLSSTCTFMLREFSW